MADDPERLEALILDLTAPGVRNQLTAKALARSLIWLGGKAPEGTPKFPRRLTSDVLDHAYALLRAAVRLRELGGNEAIGRLAFEQAGDLLTAVVSQLSPTKRDRGFHRVAASAAYHLAHYSARAYCVVGNDVDTLNLSATEHALTLLMRHSLDSLEEDLRQRLFLGTNRDAIVARRVADEADTFSVDDALQEALEDNFLRAIAIFDFALTTGTPVFVETAVQRLSHGVSESADLLFVPQWWVNLLAKTLLLDLWERSLHMLLPKIDHSATPDRWQELRTLFLALMLSKGEIELWPSQVEAARRVLDDTDDLVVALPTSAGKTRIAELCILRTLARGSRVFYLTPLRALSAQVERTLRATFHPLGFSVSAIYGAIGAAGIASNAMRDHSIVVGTPEKLDFALRADPKLIEDVGLVVLDEGHLIGPNEREVRYEAFVQRLLRGSDSRRQRFVCLSAVLPSGEELSDFVAWIRQDAEGEAVSSQWRPTRQHFGEIVWVDDHARMSISAGTERPFVPRYVQKQPPRGRRRTAFPADKRELCLATAWRLAAEGRSTLIFCPERRSVDPFAKAALRVAKQGYLEPLIDPLDTDAIAQLQLARDVGAEWIGRDHPAVACLELGIAIHHGGLPRAFTRQVDQLLRNNVVKVVVASPTLAQGLNLPASSLLFYSLFRAREVITSSEFSNVVGRVGRALVDVDARIFCVVGPDDRNQQNWVLDNWNRLVEQSGRWSLRSGVAQLIARLIDRISLHFAAPAGNLAEFLLANPERWQAIAGEDESELTAWNQDLASLDTALFSFLERLDCPTEEVPALLDEVLHGSLWERTLQRATAPQRTLQRALLVGRTNLIWRTSTDIQRKGYFAAGVGLLAGNYLDQNSALLNSLLSLADDAVRDSDEELAISAISSFAEEVFNVSLFKPHDLPSNWKEILHRWLVGRPLAELLSLDPRHAGQFVENSLVYRLVWAMEAVRARASIHEDAEHERLTGKAATAVETGALSVPAAVLIQSGLASRVAAYAALRDCPAGFADFPAMRRWLLSESVIEHTRRDDWPTPDTVMQWRTFVDEVVDGPTDIWTTRSYPWRVRWGPGGRPADVQVPLRVAHDESTERTWICTPDYERLGTLSPPLPYDPMGTLYARCRPTEDVVDLVYAGPENLRNDQTPPR